MKAILLITAIATCSALADKAFDFPIVKPLKIDDAIYLIDGGSVIITLRDSKDNQSFVSYMTKEAGKEYGGGLLTFRVKKSDVGTTFAHSSPNETQLVELLRSACVATFGSSDPDVLMKAGNASGEKEWFKRFAMASLLRHFPDKAEQVSGGNGDNRP